MRKLMLLVTCAAAILAVACDASSDGGNTTDDVVTGEADLVMVPDIEEGCDPACSADDCMVCQAGNCVSSCKEGELCEVGTCVTEGPECDPACGGCETCTDGSCVSDCTGDELCHDGSCEVPPDGCDPACGDCELCETSDIWAPRCVSACTGDELCHDGTCEVAPDCDPECDANACEVCDADDMWSPECVVTCDTDACQGCDGAGSCVGQCEADDCEACDGAGDCAVTCDSDACEVCDGVGACVVTCVADDCEVCDGSGSCESTCGADQYCDAGQCIQRPALDCEDDDGFCPGAVASSLEVAPAPADAGGDACCCDLTGDGVVDNKLGELLKLIEPFTGYDREYFNEQINEMIERGYLLYLFEPLGVDDTMDDGYVKFHVYEGVDADGIYSNNLLGGAEFLVSRESIDRDGNPLMPFDDAEIASGKLYGGPSRFVVPIDLIGAGEPIIMMMEGAHITADITEAALGYELVNGTVCGYVERSKLVSEINEYAGMNCSCLNLASEFITDHGTSLSCGAASSASTCDQFESVEYLCQQLFDNCGMIAMLMPALFDVDPEGDGTNNAMSVGFTFEAVSADIVGLEPEVL